MAGLQYTFRREFFSPTITCRIGADALEWTHSNGQDRIEFRDIKSIRLYQVRKFGIAGQTSALVWRCQVHGESDRDVTLTQDHFVRIGRRENRGLSFRFFVNALITQVSANNPDVQILHEEAGRRRVRVPSGRFLIQSLNVLSWIKPAYLEAAGGSFLRTVGPWLPEHRVGRANLAMAFPEKSPSEIERILRGVWENYGRLCAGILSLDKIALANVSAEENDKIVLSEAARRELAQYREDRKPRLIFSAHLANWEVQAPVARALGVDLVVPVRMQHVGAVATLLNRARSGDMYIPIGSDATAKLKSAIDRGACVAVMVDQHDAKGINVTLFERSCTVNPLFARLVRRLEWPILGLRTIRLPDGRTCIDLVGPLEPVRDGDGQVDVVATMQTCMLVIEQWVREHPEQWMWLHRLWRSAVMRR